MIIRLEEQPYQAAHVTKIDKVKSEEKGRNRDSFKKSIVTVISGSQDKHLYFLIIKQLGKMHNFHIHTFLMNTVHKLQHAAHAAGHQRTGT